MFMFRPRCSCAVILVSSVMLRISLVGRSRIEHAHIVHSVIEVIPISALRMDTTSEVAGLSSHQSRINYRFFVQLQL